MGDFKFRFILMDILLLIIFIGLINTIFDFSRNLYFGLNLIILLGFMFFSFIAMVAIYNDARWGFTVLFIVLGILLINMLVILYFKGRTGYFFTITLLSLLAFLISLFSIKKKEEEELKEDEPVEEEVKKEFKPGKFVASKLGKTYHTPDSDWAKKIKKSNQVWFNDEDEAKKAGYKPGSSVKEKVYKNF